LQPTAFGETLHEQERLITTRSRGRVVASVDQERAEQRMAEWAAMNERLPGLLLRLLDSDVYGLGAGRPDPPDDQHGVYLFTERERELYVGRTGLTERARLAGKSGSSSLMTRLTGHVERDPGSASFAWRLTMEKAFAQVEAGERGAVQLVRDELIGHDRMTASRLRAICRGRPPSSGSTR
jgi:hypothetical protein